MISHHLNIQAFGVGPWLQLMIAIWPFTVLPQLHETAVLNILSSFPVFFCICILYFSNVVLFFYIKLCIISFSIAFQSDVLWNVEFWLGVPFPCLSFSLFGKMLLLRFCISCLPMMDSLFWLVASNVESEEKWGKLQQKWEWYSPPKYKQKLEWKQRGIHWALSKTLGANDCCHGAFERYSPHCLMSAEVELCQIEYWFSHSNILTYYLSCHANIILKLSEMQSKLNSLIHNLNLDKRNGQYLEKYLTLFFCYNI